MEDYGFKIRHLESRVLYLETAFKKAEAAIKELSDQLSMLQELKDFDLELEDDEDDSLELM